MIDTSFRKKIFEAQIFSPVVRVESDDFVVKIIFNNGFIALKDFLNIRFSFEGIKPAVFGKVIDKNDIVFEAIRRHNRRSLDIRENDLKRMCRHKR